MDILFVNYGDFATNSLNHIGAFASGLAALGHRCAVAVPEAGAPLDFLHRRDFAPLGHEEALAKAGCFGNKGPDLIHAWTPREVVRRFVVRHAQRHTAPLVVHLEDDETVLAAAFTGRTPDELARVTDLAWSRLAPPGLTHPVRGGTFLRCADGVTVITPSLLEFVPAGVPALVLRPGIDLAFHAPRAPDAALRAALGIAPGESVIVFTGSTTFANRADNRALVVAVGLLRAGGLPVRLVRTGHHPAGFLSDLALDWRPFTTDLGFVAQERIPALHAIADVLVQPGAPGEFNARRLPSKLPEFLAAGRPVVAPAAYAALGLRDGEHALLLRDGTPDEIAAACARLLGDATLARGLARAGRAFAEEHFDLGRQTATLAAFHDEIASRAVPPRLAILRGTAWDEAAVLAADAAAAAAGTPAAPAVDALAGRVRSASGLFEEVVRLDAALGAVRAEADEVRHGRNIAAAAHAALQAEHASVRQSAAAAAADADAARAERDAVRGELEAARVDGERAHAACADANRRAGEAETARHAALQRANEAETEADRLLARLEAQAAALAEALRRSANAEADLAATTARAQALEQRSAALERERADAAARIAGLTEALGEAESRAGRFARERDEVASELAATRERADRAEARAQLERERAERERDACLETRQLLEVETEAARQVRARLEWALDTSRDDARHLRDANEALEARVAAAQLEAQRAAGRLAQSEDRVARMRASVSWTMTTPLRALRRALVDRFVRPGPLRPARVEPPTRPSGTPAAEAARLAGTAWIVHIDEPRHATRLYRFGRLTGWAFPPGGPAPTQFRLVLGEREIARVDGTQRPDVVHHHGDTAAARCGFRFSLAITEAAGDHRFHLEAKLADNVWHRFHAFRAEVSDDAPEPERGNYAHWVRQFDTLRAADEEALRARLAAAPSLPRISVLVPVFNTPERWLRRMIESVRDQILEDWELCIADDASTEPHVRGILEACAAADPRIRVAFRTANGHISEASNTALELATGEYVALLDHDDELPRHALALVALELAAHPGTDLLYTDEDKIDDEGRRHDPYFKPDWNPELALGHNLVCHLGVYRASLVRGVGGFRKGLEGSQDWDLALRVAAGLPRERIRHIPRVLYHWRAIPGSTALAQDEKSYAVTAARRLLTDHARRTGSGAQVELVGSHLFRMRYPLPEPAPKVSILIPTRNRVELLRVAVGSILARSTYPDFEILILDNGSDDQATLAYFAEVAADPRVRVLPLPGPFNYSQINNDGAAQAHGTILALVNNDIEVITPDWLEEMVSRALLPGVGAVGAKLLYPDGTIQHAGVVLGIGGVAGHAFRRLSRETQDQMNRARLAQEYCAVTGACLVVRRDLFLAVGGLDATDLKVAFNDVDLCLRLRAHGHVSQYTPFAELFHHESASRGFDLAGEALVRFQREIATMRRRWAGIIRDDPAYNPNLTRATEDFALRYAWDDAEGVPAG